MDSEEWIQELTIEMDKLGIDEDEHNTKSLVTLSYA